MQRVVCGIGKEVLSKFKEGRGRGREDYFICIKNNN